MCEGGVVMMRRSPLVRFSHACTPDRAVYTSLVADLASRGFIVASVDHTSDAFTVEFPGGELVDGQFGTPLESKQISEPELVNLVNVRTRELPQDKSCRWFGNAHQPKLAWQLTGAKHLTFSDLQTLAPQIAAARPTWPYATLYPMITGSLDLDNSIRAQRDAIARFFRTYLAPTDGRKAKPKAPMPPSGVVPVSGKDLTCVPVPG